MKRGEGKKRNVCAWGSHQRVSLGFGDESGVGHEHNAPPVGHSPASCIAYILAHTSVPACAITRT
jgi:hypothetical protein